MVLVTGTRKDERVDREELRAIGIRERAYMLGILFQTLNCEVDSLWISWRAVENLEGHRLQDGPTTHPTTSPYLYARFVI